MKTYEMIVTVWVDAKDAADARGGLDQVINEWYGADLADGDPEVSTWVIDNVRELKS